MSEQGGWGPPSEQSQAPAPTQHPAEPPAPVYQAAGNHGFASPDGLPPGCEYASPWIRLASYLVDGVLASVTLFIGWAIWALIIGGGGQTPAKKLLGLRVIRADQGRPASLGWMFWMRGIIAALASSIVVVVTLGIILFMPFWDRRNQNIWDKISNCYVVTDPRDAYGVERR